MAAASQPQQAKGDTGSYVYGIFPADIELTTERTGVGDPPGKVHIVRGGRVAALVSEVDVSRPLGTPEDLTAHKEILDTSAAAAPVLPIRFGAVLASDDAVAEELLEAHGDEFAQDLADLDGRVQYVLRGRYAEEVLLPEILAANPDAAELAEQIRGADPDAARDVMIQLGEIIGQAVAARREEDTQVVGDRVEGHCAASAVRDPSHELDAVNAAFLVDAEQEKELRQIVADLAEEWRGRVELSLLGPMAAYDFAGAQQTAAAGQAEE
jgi:hypothetical protein